MITSIHRTFGVTKSEQLVMSGIMIPMLFKSIPKGRKSMTDLGAVLATLKQERDKLDEAIAALSGLTGNSGGGGARRKLSAAARERIAAAQRKRWAKFKKKKAR